MSQSVYLEPAAKEFAEATAKPPFLYQLPPAEGRKTVDTVQSAPIDKPDVDVREATVDAGKWGKVPVKILRPKGATGKLPAVVYVHGAGWVFGNAHTHDRLVRTLAVGSNVAVVFPEYSLSPEAPYPTAIEQSYAVLTWVAGGGAGPDVDAAKLAVAGDSVGGNMATVLAIMAKDRKGPKLAFQLLFYPVTDANFDTGSYQQFATGYFLTRDAMKWFWDQYTTDPKQRAEITASPLRATVEQLKGLPPAAVLNGEADVLRDEGEAYANKLREAGVPVTAVRFQGMIHDFVMLHALAHTHATEAAFLLATQLLKKALHG